MNKQRYTNHELELLRALQRAVHEVMAGHNIALRQMDIQVAPGGPVLPADLDHVWQIGDSVIMLGSHLRDRKEMSKAQKLSSEVEAAVADIIGAGHDEPPIMVTMDIHNNVLRARMTRPKPRLVRWKDIAKQAGNAVVLGRNQETLNLTTANPLEWTPGALVTGASRVAGKSNLIRLLAAQMLVKRYDLYLGCMKGSFGWNDLAPLAYTTAWENEAGSTMLSALIARVNRRNDERESKYPPLVLVWDEASDLRTDADNQKRLAELAMVAGSSNFIMLVGIQNVGTGLERDIYDNLTNRFVGKTATVSASYGNSQVNRLQAHKLSGKGHFYFVESNGVVTEIQVPRADNEELRLAALMKKYACAEPEIHRMVASGDLPGWQLESDIADLIEQAEQTAGIVAQRMAGPAQKTKELEARQMAKQTPRFLAERMIREDVQQDSRRQPPDEKLLYKSMVHVWRYGRVPSYEQVETWNTAVTGNKTLNSRKIQVVRRMASVYHRYCCNLLRDGQVRRVELGGDFLTVDLQKDPLLESSEPIVPIREYIPIEVNSTSGYRYIFQREKGLVA